MLQVLGSHTGFSRRQLLQVGGAGMMGMHFDRLLQAEQKEPTSNPKAKAVIFVFLFGGPSQLETFDVRPDAPSTIRGPFGTIPTKTPGLRFCEHLPNLARITDKFALIKTVNHSENNHNGCHFIQTGQALPPAERGSANVSATDKDWPSFGSVVSYMDRQQPGRPTPEIPPYIYLPNTVGRFAGYDYSGQYAGWLGKEYNPMATQIQKLHATDNPFFRDCEDSQLNFQPPGLVRSPDITLDRLNRRLNLKRQFELERRKLDEAAGPQAFGALRSKALHMLNSTAVANAFDIRQESDELRDKYGRSLFGQSLLMSRRLVEAGARFVSVGWDMAVRGDDTTSWDSHRELTRVMRDHLLPGLDRSLPPFLQDLETRGMLDDTLVVVCGEIGRTPRFINRGSADGRDHWSYCFPALMTGAGIQQGAIYGESDKHAAYPLSDAVSPADIAATIYDRLGISPEARLPGPQDRPVPIAEGGRVIQGIL